MSTVNFQTLAVVIEPHPPLADAVADVLRVKGLDVLIAATHIGAADLVIEREEVHFLAAAVPAAGEDRAGAYLAEARRKNPGLAVLVMLSDPTEDTAGAPGTAVTILKPFSRSELDRAITRAMRLE